MNAQTLAYAPADLSFEDTAVAFSSMSDAELYRAYMLFSTMNSNFMVSMGTKLIKAGLAFHLPIKPVIRQTIFAHFCGGEDIEDCKASMAKLSQFGIGTILDYSVEGEKSPKGFDATADEIAATIRKAEGNPAMPFCVFKVTGLAFTPILAKVQAGEALAPQEQEAWERAQKRVDRLCREAHERGVRIFIDAEETWIQGTIDQLAEAMMAKYNRERAIVYNTYQLYMADKLRQLEADIRKAEEQGYFLGAKLVRGAYMEKERDRAADKGYPDPVQPNKAACDRDFNDALELCMGHRHRVAICAGTHNEDSSRYLAALMQQHGLERNDDRFFFAQLYGMSDHISYNLAKAGYNVAKYVPYGPVAAVMPYLFRRAAENTSIAGQSSREFRLIQKEVERRHKR
jgi:proline dehydrogenase